MADLILTEEPLVIDSTDFFEVDAKDQNQVRRIAGQVASLKSAIDPSVSLPEHFIQAKAGIETGDSQLVMDAATADYAEYYRGLMSDMLQESIQTQSPEDAIEDGLAAQEILAENEELLSGDDALEHAQIMALTGNVNRAIAERQYYERKISEIAEGTSLWEDVGNIAGMFWPDVHLDAADLTDTNVIDAEEAMKRLIINFQEAPQEQRLKMFPELVRRTREASDSNELKAINQLFSIIDPAKSVSTDFILDKIDWGTVVGPLFSSVFKLGKAVNTINKIKKTATIKKTTKDIKADDIEIEELAKAEILERKANLTGLASNKISKGARKRLTFELKDLEHKRQSLLQTPATKSGMTGAEHQAALESVNEKLTVVKDKLQKSARAAESEAELSRLEQAVRSAKTPEDYSKIAFGDTPPSLQRTRNLADEQAGRINAAVLSDETGQVAEEVGVDQITAAANTSPFRYEAHGLVGATDDLTDETVRTIEEVQRTRKAVQESLEETVTHKNFLKESALTPDEMEKVQNLARKDVQALQKEYYEQYGWRVTDAEISNSTEEGFTVTYKLNNVPVTRDVKYTINDVGELDAVEAGQVVTKLWSPSVWMDKIQKDAVEVATRIGFAQARVLGDLEQAVQVAIKDLGGSLTPSGRAARRRVDSVLIAGDEANQGTGKVFSIQELKYDGIPTDEGLVHLQDKEIAAYYGMRDIFDSLHLMKNQQVRDSLMFKGFKEVKIQGAASDVEELTSIGRPISVQALPEEAKRADFKIWNANADNLSGGIQRLDQVDVTEEGMTLIKLQNKEKIGDEFIEYALIRDDQIRTLRHNPVSYKQGYVPKVSTDGFYFVKHGTDEIVNGIKRSGTRTLRMFDNKADAEAYRLQKLDEDPTGSYAVRHDREFTAAEQEDEVISEMGGLFTSARSSREIKFGLQGDKPRRLSAFSAMERNLQHISNNIPMNEFRMGIQQRWMNSAKKYLVDPTDFNSAFKEGIEGKKAEVALRESRNWIRDQMRIPTEGERRWGSFTRRAAEWMEGKPLLDTRIPLTEKASIRRGTHVLSSKDPFATMRGAAFHTLLGWFNPAQLWVQSQGAAIAFSLDPLAAPRNMRQYMALRAGMHVRDNPDALRRTAKAAGMDEEDFIQLVDQFNRSGLKQSVKTTADYAAASQGHFIGSDALRSAADKGLIFFREGETFTRGYAFLTARASWQADNPGKVIDAMAEKEILTRTVKKMLNLNRANRAHWQKGLFSVPTQFQQITTKFIENMMPDIMPGAAKKFTAAEKTRILTGQLALYGSAGIPLGDWVISEGAGALGFGVEDLDQSTKATLANGFWGWLSNEVAGESFEFGPRGAVASGVENVIRDMFINGQPFSEAALGAFGTVPKRSLQAIATIAPMVASPIDFEWTAEELIRAGTSVARIVSTFNNSHKAHMMYKTQEIRDSKGRLIFELDRNNDLMMIFGQAAGFSPSRVADYYSLKNFNRNMSSFRREKADALRALWFEYTSTGMTDQDKRNLTLRTQFLLGTANPAEQAKIREMASKSLWSAETESDKAVLKAIKEMITYDDSTAGAEGLITNTNIKAE